MMNGEFNPNDLTFTPPTGEYFQTVIMHRTAAEIAADRLAAKAWFKQRFGVDFRDSDTVGNITFSGFMLDPRTRYGAYTISGESVPSTGWEVRDGGWNMRVGAGGATLHGTWGGAAGKSVPAGASAVFGNYNIKVEGRSGDAEDSANREIILHYQSHNAITPNSDGFGFFQCELTSPVSAAAWPKESSGLTSSSAEA